MIVQMKFKIGTENTLAQKTGALRLGAGRLHDLVGLENFAMDIVVAILDTQRIGGDRHALNQHVRVVAQNVPVLAGARLTLIRIAHQIFFTLVVLRHEAPLQAGGETRPAPAAQVGSFDFGDDGLG